MSIIANCSREQAASLATSMYEGEQCRICGKPITKTGMFSAIFVGYSKTHPTRIAHKICWDANRDQATWEIPE